MNDTSALADELLPCPFCGSKDIEMSHTESNWPAVGCNECGTLGPCTDLHSAEAIKAWNTRATSQPTDAVPSLEAMKAAVELEVNAALGFATTEVIGRIVQKAIDAALGPTVEMGGDARAAPPVAAVTTEGEPVAWMRIWSDGTATYFGAAYPPKEIGSTTLTPLYAALPAAKTAGDGATHTQAEDK